MPQRRKHQRKEIEDVVRLAEQAGWTFDTSRRGHWQARCACGSHLRTVALTPSNPYYQRQLLSWFKRTCWKESP